MRPMPREPPVIRALRPFSEKSWVVSMCVCLLDGEKGKVDSRQEKA
jgi:hypothetical protein